MAENLAIVGRTENGVIVLTVRYGQELLLERRASERLSTQLTERYQGMRKQPQVGTTSCVVEIQSEIAGSLLVRALFELWREVVGKEGGQVICVGYPQDYIDSLTSLGLTTLSGFSLAETTAEALNKLAPS